MVAGLLLITAGLSVPLVLMPPDETAAQSPVTDVTRAQELVADRFSGDLFEYALLLEASDGEILDQESLVAVLDNAATMRSDPEIGTKLLKVFRPELGREVHGLWTIADSADALLRDVGVDGGLAAASDSQVDGIVAALVEEAGVSAWGLAEQTYRDEEGVWHSPALFTTVVADNQALGGGGFLATIGSANLDKEYFARDLTAVMSGDGDELNAWSPASDVNLTSNEQGRLAGPFIGLTIAAVLIIVGIAFRSYWAVAVAGAALGMLMVWLKGGSNLVGFKSDQILNTILPISMISFGIDSAFHGISRVREAQKAGGDWVRSFTVGIAAVFSALALAAISDGAAFLSNSFAGIESVVQFGFAAAVATLAAFVLLGLGTPLVIAMAEGNTDFRSITRAGPLGDFVFGSLAAAGATATVVVLVFVSELAGVGLLAGYVLLALVLPFLIARRGRGVTRLVQVKTAGREWVGASVHRVAARPWIAVGVAAMVTGTCVWGASQLQVAFDVNDFFSSDSEFVIGLDKTAEYLGSQGGEPAQVVVEGQLDTPEAIVAIEEFLATVGAVSDHPFAVDASGEIRVNAGLLDLVNAASADSSATSASLGDLYATALSDGFGSGEARWSASDVGRVIWQGDDRQATVIGFQIPDTRDQSNIVAARKILEPAAGVLEAQLAADGQDAHVVVTGSSVYRDEQLAAIRRAMLIALPIAVIACLAIAVVFMRSLRYALVTVVPILLVVAWLFGFMRVAGYSINVVTSIIGAVSIGIGIDFSTHFTMRFLEERRQGLGKHLAVAAAGRGTGTALFGSAITSVAGFGALAFAPMPLFASYGLLTAVMIAMALVASLYVLPSLLVIVTPERKRRRPRTQSSEQVAPRIRIGLDSELDETLVDHVRREAAKVGALANAGIDVGELAAMIESGEADLVITEQRIRHLSRVLVVPLASDEMVVVSDGPDDAPIEAAVLQHGLIVSDIPAWAIEKLQNQARRPLLVQRVVDAVAGVRLAELTGGVMVIRRSAAGNTPTRSFEPPIEVGPNAYISDPLGTNDALASLIAELQSSLSRTAVLVGD